MNFDWNDKTRFRIYGGVTADRVNIQITSVNILYNNNKKFNGEYLPIEVQKQVDEINILGVTNIPEGELREITQSISDYYGLSHETEEVLSNYMIVAAYSFFEKGLKKIMAFSKKFSEPELKSCFKIKNVVSLLKHKFNIDYDQLADYQSIEELRCLNNAIKHNGVVGRELVIANPKWILNEPVGNTISDFERLMNAPRNLLKDLVSKIEPHL